MQVRTRRISAVLAALLLGTVASIGQSTAAIAEPAATLPPEVIDQYETVFADHGVDSGHWDGLIDKVEAGQMIDADNPDATPVSATTVTRDGEPAERLEFADGSVAFQGVEEPEAADANPGTVQPLGTAVKNCTKNSTQGWKLRTNCRVVYDGISFSYSFRANFRFKSGARAVITGAHSPLVHRAIAHSYSNRDTRIVRSRASGSSSSSTPARAQMSFDAVALYVAWSRTIHLDIFVRNTSYWSSTNL